MLDIRLMNHRSYNAGSRMKPLAKLAVCVLSAMILMSGCALLPKEEEALVPPLVQPVEEELRLIEASLGTIETFLRGTASFTPSVYTDLMFRDSGRLKSINVHPGQYVQEGDILAELDLGDLEMNIKQTRLDLERVQLQFMQARESGLTGINLRLREIDLEKVENQLAAMEERLNKGIIRAPFSGKITWVDNMVKINGPVNAYSPIISIADTSQLYLTYTASQSKELLSLEVGNPVIINYRGVEYTGEILQTPSSAPTGLDQFKAERNAVLLIIGVHNLPDNVEEGHHAQITIPLQKRENVIVLPRSAVRSYMGRNYVQVMDGEIRRDVDVEVGLQTPTEAEIVKGIEVGQIVVY